MSTLSAKTTGAFRSLPTACRFGEGPSWLSTRHWCPRSPPQARLVGQGVALQAPHCSLHDEPKSAPTLSCAGLAAAGSPSLQLKWVAAGVLRPPPSSDSLRGARHAPHRHPRELLPSPRSPYFTLRWSALLSFAAARSFAASLLSLPLTGTANVDGELPPLSDMLADSVSLPPLASRLV